MAADDLTTQGAVEAKLLRPLTSLEAQYLPALIDQAQERLRTAMPAVDVRIAAFAVDPTVPTAIRPGAVSAMLAGVIARFLNNPKGLWSRSDAQGPSTHSETYPGARGGDGADGGAFGPQVTSADLASLVARPAARIGTIRVRPGLC